MPVSSRNPLVDPITPEYLDPERGRTRENSHSSAPHTTEIQNGRPLLPVTMHPRVCEQQAECAQNENGRSRTRFRCLTDSLPDALNSSATRNLSSDDRAELSSLRIDMFRSSSRRPRCIRDMSRKLMRTFLFSSLRRAVPASPTR